MNAILKFVFRVLFLFAVLAVVVWVWPGPQLREAGSAPVPVLATRDPMIGQLANNQAQQNQVLMGIATQLAQPTATPIPATPIAESADIPAPVVPVTDVQGELFQSPVQTTDVFNQDSAWMIAEPGVLLDNTAAWTIPGTKTTWYINVPEGGFTYFSMGQGKIVVDGFTIDLPYQEGNNYLILIRGQIDDGIVDSDLNKTAEITDFVPGHAIWSIMPPGAYVSHDWFRDQLVVSTTTTGTNCGATGCSKTKVVLFDVDSHTYQVFEVKAGALDNWTLVQ